MRDSEKVKLSIIGGVDTVYRWSKAYDAEGTEAFVAHERNRVYGVEEKSEAVHAYLANEGGLQTIAQKYHLRSSKQLQDWLKVYNAHGDFNSVKFSGGGSYMKQGRETTQQERMEIVRECIAGGKNYGAMALKYKVSYQQIRNWTLRYEEMGEAGLKDLTCPNGKQLTFSTTRHSKSKSGFVSEASVYRCNACVDCPMKKLCTKSASGRIIQRSKAFWAYRAEAQERITSELGTQLRMNRSIQSEGTFGVLKQDWGFRRFLRRGSINVFTEVLLYLFALNVMKLHSKMQRQIDGVIIHQLKASWQRENRIFFPVSFASVF